MIDWMYQDRSAFNKQDGATAEEYLLGKAVTDKDLDQKMKKQQELTEAYTTTENEAFLRMKDDPLLEIRRLEMEQRNQVLNNPMTLKRIKEEIEMLKKGGHREKKKKDKKEKKEKKGKKEKRRRERSYSSDRDRHERHERHDREMSPR
jgi:hypothetical protein